MKVEASGIPDAICATLQGWGWELTSQDPDAFLTICGHYLEIRAAATLHADDMIFLPLIEAELTMRIHAARERHARLARRLHDLRSPLNAIQGYAEMIAETAEGDVLRCASNIRTASETLTQRLGIFREEGV